MSQVRFADTQAQVQDYLRQASTSPVMHRASLSGNPGAPPLFKAPAHKHAHHLHSIPPREKSTRTLIIDHLLWVHARTRFAQARAELGMTDRTGGPNSANYMHRERPENYEEEDEVVSDGEDVFMLAARSGGPDHAHGEEEEERLEMQELNLARNLRQRAESIEKVTTSMLNQPPEIPPLHPDDLLESTPTSPQLLPQNIAQQHILPNGVRLRLALATVVNDLFSRKAPSPQDRVHHTVDASTTSHLPPSLIPLSLISAASPSSNAVSSAYRKPTPNEYIRSLYFKGSDPDTSNSPPSLRCPRHLHMGCEICVEAKSHANTRPARSRNSSGRAGSTTGSSPGDFANGVSSNGDALIGGVTGWQDGPGIGSGLARPGPKGTVLRRVSHSTSGSSTAADEGGVQPMQNTKLTELIVRFMRLSALVAMELGREAMEDRMSVDGDVRRDDDGATVTPSTSPSTRPHVQSPQTSPRVLPNRGSVQDINLHANAFRPSREWYFLLAGLLTRAVFEGYMTAQWRGIEPLEVLLGVGLGLTSRPKKSTSRNPQSSTRSDGDVTEIDDLKLEDDDEYKEFDPDDLPDLEDAARVLFPSLRDAGGRDGAPVLHSREGAELEYQIEMVDRLGRVRFAFLPSYLISRAYRTSFWLAFSFMMCRGRHPTSLRTWRTSHGSSLLRSSSEQRSDSAKLSQDGEANPSSKR